MSCHEGRNTSKNTLSNSYKDSFSKENVTQQKSHKGLMYTAIIALGLTPAIIGNVQINQDRNEKLKPLRLEFIAAANENYVERVTENGNVKLDYDGALFPITNAKNRFASDNRALALDWKAYKVPGGREVETRTPNPITINFIDAYKRFITNEKQPVNTAAIDNYFAKKK